MYKRTKKIFFKTTPPKRSSGQSQWVFDNFFESFQGVDWSYFVQPPKKFLRTFSSSKCSFGYIECSPGNPAKRGYKSHFLNQFICQFTMQEIEHACSKKLWERRGWPQRGRNRCQQRQRPKKRKFYKQWLDKEREWAIAGQLTAMKVEKHPATPTHL